MPRKSPRKEKIWVGKCQEGEVNPAPSLILESSLPGIVLSYELDLKVPIKKLNQNPGKRKSFKVCLGKGRRFDDTVK